MRPTKRHGHPYHPSKHVCSGGRCVGWQLGLPRTPASSDEEGLHRPRDLDRPRSPRGHRVPVLRDGVRRSVRPRCCPRNSSPPRSVRVASSERPSSSCREPWPAPAASFDRLVEALAESQRANALNHERLQRVAALDPLTGLYNPAVRTGAVEPGVQPIGSIERAARRGAVRCWWTCAECGTMR